MKAKTLSVLLLFSLCVFIIAILPAGAAEQQAATAGKAAMVNGVVIPEEEVNRGLHYQQQRLLATTGMAIRPDMMPEARRMVLEELIDRELLYQQSRKKGVVIEDAQVNEELDRLKKQYPSEQAFRDSLTDNQLTESTVKAQIKTTMTVRKFVEREFGAAIDVPESEAKAFYEKNPQYFTSPETVRLSQILIKGDPKSDPSKKGDARKRMEDLQKRIQKGEDFSILAKDFSQDASAAQGGDMGALPRGRMPKAFDAAAFALKPGEVSNIVETELGFHLIKVHEKKPENMVPFKDAEEKIREHLANQKLRQRVNEFLDEVKKTAKIERISTKGAN